MALRIIGNWFERFLALGNDGEDQQLAGRIRAAQIEAVLRYTPWMMLANIASSLLIVAFYWATPAVAGVALWGGTISSLAGITIWNWWRQRHREVPPSASLRGIRRTVVHAAILGFVWSLLPALFYHDADLNQRLVVACVIVGMLCGSGFVLATITPAAIMFAGMLALGSFMALLRTPGFTEAVTLVLNTIYVAVIFNSALSLSRTLKARFEAQVKSEEQREFIRLLLNDFEEHGSDWLWVIDRRFRIVHVSSRLCEVLGVSEDSLIGRHVLRSLPMRRLSEQGPEGRRAIGAVLQAVGQTRAFRDLEIPVRVGGSDRLWSLTARPVFREDGRFDGYRGVGRDVTQASEARRKIEYMAKYDALTGLPNRVMLNEDLGRAVARLKRQAKPFALLLLDLDHFKFINDTQGHPVGDALLKGVAGRLLAAAGPNDTVARLGGDEFAIVATGLASPAEAGSIAERLVTDLGQPFLLGTSAVQIGTSIGIAYAQTGETDADTLIRHADLALYRAKSMGRGRHSFFEPELDAAARRRHQIESDLRLALEQGGLELYYQPLVQAASGDITCFEALMRWNHATLGVLSPAEFIPLAEESGLINQLGAWSLQAACRQAQEWPLHIRVAVNLSPVQFRSPTLFNDVRTALETTGLRPDRLELEVTESLLLDASELVQSTLAALQGLDVRIALDDFGTGYSSLSYLREYAFDKLKIDRSFVQNVESEAECRAIIKAIIQMAGDLGIAVSVEGVETAGQLRIIQAMGCDEVQGYLISRPMPAAAITATMAGRLGGLTARGARRA